MNNSWSNKLSVRQRSLLLRHIDGPLPIITGDEWTTTRTSLLSANLLAGFNHHSTSKRPTHTVLTPNGRKALAKMLADCAETLIQAGFLEPYPEALDDAILTQIICKSARREPKNRARPLSLAPSTESSEKQQIIG